MGFPDTPRIICCGAVADADVVQQLKELCAMAGVAFESFAHHGQLLEQLGRREVDFVILDADSPREGGDPVSGLPVIIDATRRIRPGLPILYLLPPASNDELKGAALAAGVTDFLSRPFSRPEFSVRVSSLAQRALARRHYQHSSRIHEGEIRVTIGEIMLREAETLYVLGKAAEYKDRETGLHIARVAHYSQLIARVIGQSGMNQDAVFHASALHDIGKLGIPDAVLVKPGRLTEAEFTIMKTHAVIGYNILKDSQSSYLLTGAMIALTHHEKYDGTGYPMRLKGEEIPLFGRIVGIADVFDALTTKRAYKDVWPLGKAFDLLAGERGRQFDPTLIDAFLSHSLAVEEIYHNNADALAAADGINIAFGE
jgi:response regulator RpfG family c-di-GMP phosphodiesterase